MKTQLITGVLLLALLLSSGGAIYYHQRAGEYRNRLAEAAAKLSVQPQPAQPSETPRMFHLSSTNSTDEIMKEFDALLLELEQKDREIAELQSSTNRIRRVRNRPSDAERQARLDELKLTDPKAYEEMMARREERRNRVQTAFAERASTLLDRTPSNLSEEESVEREQMLQMLNETWMLTEKMNSPDTPREERRAIRDELSEMTRELRPLLTDERDRQLYELGISSGYSESESEAFVDYINETIKATTVPSSGRRGGGSSRSQ